MDVPVRPPGQPSFDRCGFVGGVVVHDDVDVEPGRNIAVDHLEEVEELPGPVAAITLADDRAGGDVEGGEQRGRAVALVIVGAPLRDAGQHRQTRLPPRHSALGLGRPHLHAAGSTLCCIVSGAKDTPPFHPVGNWSKFCAALREVR